MYDLAIAKDFPVTSAGIFMRAYPGITAKAMNDREKPSPRSVRPKDITRFVIPRFIHRLCLTYQLRWDCCIADRPDPISGMIWIGLNLQYHA
jgi:hypothetical protein